MNKEIEKILDMEKLASNDIDFSLLFEYIFDLIIQDKTNIINKAIDWGFDIHKKNSKNQNAYFILLIPYYNSEQFKEKEMEKCLSYFNEKKLDINQQDDAKETPLLKFWQEENLYKMFIIDYKANFNLKTNSGKTLYDYLKQFSEDENIPGKKDFDKKFEKLKEIVEYKELNDTYQMTIKKKKKANVSL